MFIFISAFILKQICRCLFKSVCSDPCSAFLPVCLLQIPECSWKRRQSESFTQHQYLGALEPELPCTHRASATLPLGKSLHPHDAISQDISAGVGKSSRGWGGEHAADGLDLPQETQVSAAGSFQLPQFCVPSLVSSLKTIPVPMEVPGSSQSLLGCRTGGINKDSHKYSSEEADEVTLQYGVSEELSLSGFNLNPCAATDHFKRELPASVPEFHPAHRKDLGSLSSKLCGTAEEIYIHRECNCVHTALMVRGSQNTQNVLWLKLF